LNYHIGRIVLGSMRVGVSVWLGWSGIRVAGIYPSSGACDYLFNYYIGRIVLGSMCVGVSVWLGWRGIRVAGEIMCIWDSYVYQKVVPCFVIHKSYVRSIKKYCFVRNYATIPVQLEIFILQHAGWRILIIWTFIVNQFGLLLLLLLSSSLSSSSQLIITTPLFL